MELATLELNKNGLLFLSHFSLIHNSINQLLKVPPWTYSPSHPCFQLGCLWLIGLFGLFGCGWGLCGTVVVGNGDLRLGVRHHHGIARIGNTAMLREGTSVIVPLALAGP